MIPPSSSSSYENYYENNWNVRYRLQRRVLIVRCMYVKQFNLVIPFCFIKFSKKKKICQCVLSFTKNNPRYKIFSIITIIVVVRVYVIFDEAFAAVGISRESENKKIKIAFNNIRISLIRCRVSIIILIDDGTFLRVLNVLILFLYFAFEPMYKCTVEDKIQCSSRVVLRGEFDFSFCFGNAHAIDAGHSRYS